MIFFFYGDDSFVPEEQIAALTARFDAKNPTSGGRHVFDFTEDGDVRAVADALRTQDLFAAHQLIVVRDMITNTKAPEQKELIAALEAGTQHVVVFWERRAPRKNSALYKWLLANADKKQKCTVPEGRDLTVWIGERADHYGAQIAPEAADHLARLQHGSLHRLDQEIAKCAAYSDGKEIRIEIIELLVVGQVEAEVFATTEALVRGETRSALELIAKHRAAGDDFYELFGMFAYQTRVLVAVKDLAERGVVQEGAIAKEAKLHPFVVKKALSAVRRTSLAVLLKRHKLLTTLDREVKTGARSIDDALVRYVMAWGT